MKPEIDMMTLNVGNNFNKKQSADQQTLFRERQVDNLQKLIYESKVDPFEDVETEDITDTNRYDVHRAKLEKFRNGALKKHLKSRFVTGQS